MNSDLFPTLRRVALVLIVVFMPIEIGAIIHEVDGTADAYNRLLIITPMDLAVLLLLITSARELRSTDRRLGLGGWTLLVMAGFAAITLPFNASLRGLGVVVRLLLAVLVWREVTRLDAEDRRVLVVIPFLASAALQTVVALLQAIDQAPLGLEAVGERQAFHVFGSTVGVQGTTLHPYVLAGFAVTAIVVAIGHRTIASDRSRALVVGIAVAAVPLGITYSRMAFLGWVAMLAALGWGAMRRRAEFGPVLFAVAAGALVPALVWSGGWVDRASDSVGTNIDSISSARITRIEESIDLIRDHPLVGVGPGHYTVALEEDVPGLTRYDAVHTVPLLIAAENGLIAGLVILGLLGFLGIRALRDGPAATAVYVGFMPFVLLDKFPYRHPNGIVMLAVWLAILDLLSRNRAELPSVVPESAAAAQS